MNESQEGYYTVTSGSWGVSILKNNCDHQFAAYMIDAFAAGAKNYVTPAYIEVNLKRKSLRDDDSERILEDIFDSIVYDAGAVYDFGGISTMFSNLVSQGSADIVSSFDSVRDQALNAIEDVIDAYAQDDEKFHHEKPGFCRAFPFACVLSGVSGMDSIRDAINMDIEDLLFDYEDNET